jgi:CHAD domain-containing protein
MQHVMRERELKLAIHGTFLMPDLAADGAGVVEMRDLPEQELRSTYHDTADLRLGRMGVTLRYRTGDEDGPCWTLKLRVPGLDATERDEHLLPGLPEEVPAAARDLVTAIARSEPLRPVASLLTRRRRWLLCGEGDRPLAELVEDEVSVLDGDRVVSRFRELELESRGPGLDELRPIAARLRRAGAVLAEPLPKAIRALGPRAAAPPDVSEQRFATNDPARRAVEAAIASGTSRLVVNDSGTRLGDEESLHQMRVATRRLRSDLRTLRPLVDTAWSEALREELRWLGGLLGAVRDLDVQLGRLERMAGDLLEGLAPLVETARAERVAAREALLAGLRSERYVLLLDRLIDAAHDPLVAPGADVPSATALPPLIGAAWRPLRQLASALRPEDPDERYHAVRIAAKRLRYAAELAAPGLGPRYAALAKSAAALQDLLGTAQDAVVGMARIEAATAARPDDARLAWAAGRLYEREARAREGARARFAAAWQALRQSHHRVRER